MKHFTLPKDGGLIEKGLPQDILHSYEKIPAQIFEDPDAASKKAADEIIAGINAKKGKFKLSISSGSTSTEMLSSLVAAYKAGKVSFADVEFYTCDKFIGTETGPASRHYTVREEFLKKVDIKPENIHIVEDNAKFDKAFRECDILVTGVGENGQLALNESGSAALSRTRSVLLSYKTRKKYAKLFQNEITETPKSAITVGISTIKAVKKIIILAWGEDKAQTVYDIVEKDASIDCPASLLQGHDNIEVFADENSAILLTRYVAPWLVGPCDWTPKFVRKAVVWLSAKTGKPVLKLTQNDYLEHSLGELLEKKGSFDKINIDVFNDLQHTITGWPGGKPNADDSTRPVASKPFPKKVVIFSPHPDDDVISMGGTFIRLVEQGHDVHVCYETSGNVAVHDDVVLQHMDAAHELGFADKFAEVKKLVESKKPGQPEPRALLDIKAAIRRSEARGAVRSFGLNPDTNAHFLNLPFYETGGIKKGKRTQKDIDIIIDILQKVQPDQIFMAGDLADPHGTHRVCTEAVLEALRQLKDEKWLKNCHAWLYRGAWMEWDLGSVDMAVPLSPAEVIKKRHAIYRHLSQKDIVPFPGDDPREFWQRAEDRTQNTARLYNETGMAEYQAMEVFLKLF